jgi:hypothetical protein
MIAQNSANKPEISKLGRIASEPSLAEAWGESASEPIINIYPTPSRITIKTCPSCNIEFESINISKVYCSYRCKFRSKISRRSVIKVSGKFKPDERLFISKVCSICNSSFEPTSGRQLRCHPCKFLVESTRKEPKEKITKPEYLKICQFCSNNFNTRRNFQVYCSRVCSRKKNKAKPSDRARSIKTRIGSCEACGHSNILSLQTHHINNATRSDSIDNLMVLCANCHTAYHGTIGFSKKSESQTKECVLAILKSINRRLF